mgnify:CR=1 FL=1
MIKYILFITLFISVIALGVISIIIVNKKNDTAIKYAPMIVICDPLKYEVAEYFTRKVKYYYTGNYMGGYLNKLDISYRCPTYELSYDLVVNDFGDINTPRKYYRQFLGQKNLKGTLELLNLEKETYFRVKKDGEVYNKTK